MRVVVFPRSSEEELPALELERFKCTSKLARSNVFCFGLSSLMFVIYDAENVVHGKAELGQRDEDKSNGHGFLLWICAEQGFGTPLLKFVEEYCQKTLTYSALNLNCVIDTRTEKEEVLRRRLNFYMKNNYRVSLVKEDERALVLKMIKNF